MCRVLILDDDPFGAQTVKLVIESNSDNKAEAFTTVKEATDRVIASVQEGKPFEAFLIDLQLADGGNGIEVMKEFRRISPETETIIFTGYGDSISGLNAYKAGAFRYLAKPYDNDELLYLIDALREWRKTRMEHGWQKQFTRVMEVAMQQDNFHATANIIVNHALKLGFKRAHLFWVPTQQDANKENLFIGISCAGKGSIPQFEGGFFPVMDWFDLRKASRESNAITLRDPHTDKAVEAEGMYDFRLPALEATILPVRRGKKLAGYLLLDFDQEKRTLSEHERSLLNLFARQVSVTLNRASLHGGEQLLLQESSIIQAIGRQITTKAASVNLNDLLEEIRRQIGILMDVSNFSVFLLNEETNELNFHLLYEKGKRRQGVTRTLGNGVEEYLLTSRKELLLSQPELDTFVRSQRISINEVPPSSLLGVPLRVEEKTIGGVIVSQYSTQASEYFERDKRILLSVTQQVAGAIQISRLAEAERQESRRMQILQRASTEMLRIVQESEDNFWLTLLTIATSGFGLGFNRALLFLGEENLRALDGRMGVGTETEEEARRDWKKDEVRKYDFDRFLKDLKNKKVRRTPFETRVRDIHISLSATGGTVLHEVIEKQAWQVVQEKDLPSRLPEDITQKFSLSTCAVLPLRAGRRALGAVIVDNKHNHEPLRDRSIDRLQNVLDNAGLVYETYQEQEKSASLLKANYEILGGAKDQSLKETLGNICRTAKVFTNADWVIILPLLEGDPHHLDVTNMGFAGTLNNPLNQVIEETSHFGGISRHVLKKNTLVIRDIEDRKNPVNKQLNISDHHFIKSEGVKALIGAAIHSKEDEKPIGLLYLDYRQPQKFSNLEQQQALSFASLAGVAISNSRSQRQQITVAKEIAETVGLGLDLEKTMESIIQILHKVFEKTRLCVLLYQHDKNSLQFAPATLKYYKIENKEYRKQDIFPLDGKSIACRVARKALQTRQIACENVGNVYADPDYIPLSGTIRSELCVSLMSTKNELLGALVLERNELNAFKEADEDFVKTVAQQLNVAIERAQQSEELAFRSTVAAQTAWAADIAHEINNEVGQIRNWAYMIRDQLEEGSILREYAKKIEESASVLSSAGPWSDQPTQVIRLDPFLERHLTSLVSQQNLTPDFNFTASDAYILVNPTALQRVLRQLVRNAARAMSNSTVKKLTVNTHLLANSTVEILFRDSGPGISEEVRLSLFQRPVTTKGRGGYGLLLVRQMVEDMHGRISLVPQKRGQGATFSIRFPVASLMSGETKLTT